jgi:putative DNA-invertase from lambdoid prophage Rac
MNAAIYLRVSGRRQDEENQAEDCRSLCSSRGWFVCEPVREVGSAALNRPRWRGLLDRVHRGEIGAVVVWSLDRMGRDMAGILADVKAIRAGGGVLASVREPWLGQGLSQVEDLLLAVMAWFAEFERRRMRERVAASHERIRHNLQTRGEHVTRAGKIIRRFGRPDALTWEQRRDLETLAMVVPRPCVSALARRYGVARATVRAALDKLRNAPGEPLAESDTPK